MGCVAGGASFLDRYKIGAKLGEGGCAAVVECSHRQTKKECAVKVVSCGGGDAEAKLREANNEVAIWRLIGENNFICGFVESYHEGRIFYIVMEVCRGGELAEGLASTSSAFDLCRIFKEMLLGLQACHQASVVHRDIKPGNFLLGGDDRQTVKLCDFGVSISLSNNLYDKYGTVPYMSPEMISAAKARKSYGLPTDVWSLGIAVYLILYGDYPFRGKGGDAVTWEAAILADTEPSFKRKEDVSGPVVSEAMESFTRMLLQRDPSTRVTATIALEHALLSVSVVYESDFREAGSEKTTVFAEAAMVCREFVLKAGLDETVDELRRKSVKKSTKSEGKSSPKTSENSMTI